MHPHLVLLLAQQVILSGFLLIVLLGDVHDFLGDGKNDLLVLVIADPDREVSYFIVVVDLLVNLYSGHFILVKKLLGFDLLDP